MQLKWEAKLRVSLGILRSIVTIILCEKTPFWCIILGTMLKQRLGYATEHQLLSGARTKKMMASSDVSWRQNTRLHGTWYFTVIGLRPVTVFELKKLWNCFSLVASLLKEKTHKRTIKEGKIYIEDHECSCIINKLGGKRWYEALPSILSI